MIQCAQKYGPVSYIGFDLFEDATPETNKQELNGKKTASMESVFSFIRESCPGAAVDLVKGNTRQTLYPITADFTFIDGGHSVETIRNDYDKLKSSRVIVFDDYYLPDSSGEMPDIESYGCNLVVDGKPHVVLESDDRISGMGGRIGMAVLFGGT